VLNASANTRKVLVALWLVRNNDEANYLSSTALMRRTGLGARDVRRVLAMLARRGMVTRYTFPNDRAAVWFTSAKGNAYAERISRAHAAADQARRTAELAR